MKEQEREKLADIIKELRGDRSLRALARELKVSAVAVNSWENCDSVPSVESLDKIAKARGWSLYQLLSYIREENIDPTPSQIIEQAQKLPNSEKLKLATLLLTKVQG